MQNATIILVIIVIILLLSNHLNRSKGVLWAIISIIASCIKILAIFNPISAFSEEPITLKLMLLSGIIGFFPMPSLLLYIKSIIKKPAKFDYLLFLLLIPPVLYAVNLIPYFQLPIADQIQVFQGSLIQEKVSIWVSWEITNRLNDLYNSTLGALVLVYLLQIITKNKQTLSKKSYLLLVQICFIIIVNYTLTILFVLNKYVHFFPFEGNGFISSLSLILPLSIILFPRYLYDNINNSDLTFYLKLMNHISSKEDKTDANQDKLITDASRVLAYLHNEKPYLSTDFSKHDIARSLDIPQNIVTDCFSKIIKIPFPVLRNQLRVEFAIEKFKNSGHINITIAGIASESGFKNRSTFYTAFKDVTKMTPVEWIKQNCDFQLEED
jgi:AraC-like DNA-binding protein